MLVEKVSETQVQVTKEIVVTRSLDQLIALSANLGKSIANMQVQKDEYDAQIVETKTLGVKTQAEIK